MKKHIALCAVIATLGLLFLLWVSSYRFKSRLAYIGRLHEGTNTFLFEWKDNQFMYLLLSSDSNMDTNNITLHVEYGTNTNSDKYNSINLFKNDEWIAEKVRQRRAWIITPMISAMHINHDGYVSVVISQNMSSSETAALGCDLWFLTYQQEFGFGSGFSTNAPRTLNVRRIR